MKKLPLTALLTCTVISGASVTHAAPAKSQMKVTQVRPSKPAPRAVATKSGRPAMTAAEQRRRAAEAKRIRDRALKIANQEFMAAIAEAGLSGETVRSTKKVPTPTATPTP
jgi:hypothetical protein